MSKAYTPNQSAESRKPAAAAQSAVRRSASLADNPAQHVLADAFNGKPRILQQKAFFDSVGNSPYVIKQRQRTESLFGAPAMTGMAQRMEAPRRKQPGPISDRAPLQAKDDPETFRENITPHLREIVREKGEISIEALYGEYDAFTDHTDLTTDQFASLLKAQNVNPGGRHEGPRSRSLTDVREKVFSVFTANAGLIEILRADLTKTPLGFSVDFETLLKKIGEGDVQGPKLQTLANEILLGNDLFDLALRIGDRIAPEALKSFQLAYAKSIMQAESKVMKKINRELDSAIAILTHDKSVTLLKSSLSFKLPVLSENAEFDLLFGRGAEERTIVEVQSIPNTIGGQPAYESGEDLSTWNPKTMARLIEYLVTTMYEKRLRLSLVQKTHPELRNVPMVLMTTRKLPDALNNALTASGMFLPVMQEHMSLSETIDAAVVSLKLGTSKSKGKAGRLAAAQEHEAAQLQTAPGVAPLMQPTINDDDSDEEEIGQATDNLARRAASVAE